MNRNIVNIDADPRLAQSSIDLPAARGSVFPIELHDIQVIGVSGIGSNGQGADGLERLEGVIIATGNLAAALNPAGQFL
jgi:hypothetical protein